MHTAGRWQAHTSPGSRFTFGSDILVLRLLGLGAGFVRFRLMIDTLVPVPWRQVADAVLVAG